MNCFCGRPAVAACAWKIEQPTATAAGELLPGDRIYKRRRSYAIRTAVKSEDGRLIYVKLEGHKYERSFYVDTIVKAWKLSACGEECCEFHVRQPAERTAYCFCHWASWEEAA